MIKVSCANWKLFANSVIVNNLNLDFYSQNEFLKLKITNQKAAGQYQCEADNGIDEKQSKLIQVNVAGRNFVLFYEFCAWKFELFLVQNVELKSVFCLANSKQTLRHCVK